jgi:hypothetical protein
MPQNDSLAAQLAVIVGSGALLVYLQFNPRDRIGVVVRNIQPNTVFIFLACDTGNKLQGMDWSPKNIFPGSMSPQDCIWSSRSERDNNELSGVYVKWKWGVQYGVIQGRSDRTWWITRFNEEEIGIERNRIVGDGVVTLDLLRGKTMPLPRDDVHELGIEHILDRVKPTK